MEEKVILYTLPGCPLCKGIAMRLNSMNIKFEEVCDRAKMIEMGFKTSPVLVVGDNAYAGAKTINDYLKGAN